MKTFLYRGVKFYAETEAHMHRIAGKLEIKIIDLEEDGDEQINTEDEDYRKVGKGVYVDSEFVNDNDEIEFPEDEPVEKPDVKPAKKGKPDLSEKPVKAAKESKTKKEKKPNVEIVANNDPVDDDGLSVLDKGYADEYDFDPTLITNAVNSIGDNPLTSLPAEFREYVNTTPWQELSANARVIRKKLDRKNRVKLNLAKKKAKRQEYLATPEGAAAEAAARKERSAKAAAAFSAQAKAAREAKAAEKAKEEAANPKPAKETKVADKPSIKDWPAPAASPKKK